MDSQRDNLRVALFVAAAASAAAVIPIWPYGYYTLLRIVVTAVAVFAIVVLGNASASRTVGLALFALLFNPFVPIHLTRALWFPFDLGVAVWFVYIAVTGLSDDTTQQNPDPVQQDLTTKELPERLGAQIELKHADLSRMGELVRGECDEIIAVRFRFAPPPTDADLAHLKGLTSLQNLYLRNASITDAGLAHLEGLISLECLYLSHTQITGVGLAHLKGLTRLQELWLDSTSVTDAGLAHLEALISLEYLQLDKTQITGAGPGVSEGADQPEGTQPPRRANHRRWSGAS